MAAPKGTRPPAAGMGRKPGVPNKTTASVKAALEEAFEGLGGAASLITWAQGNETEFYKLWIKMLPTEVKADIGGSFADLLMASMKKQASE